MVTHHSRILAEGRLRRERQFDGFRSSKSNHLEARGCGMESEGCYLRVENLRLQPSANAWFVIDEAQG